MFSAVKTVSENIRQYGYRVECAIAVCNIRPAASYLRFKHSESCMGKIPPSGQERLKQGANKGSRNAGRPQDKTC